MSISRRQIVAQFAILTFAALIWPAQAQPVNSAKQDPNQWEREIKAFEAADKINPPPADAVLFVGSSSMRLWTNVQADFPEYKVINRGFGGSQISDSVRYFSRIVQPYRPKVIVFYAGDNDLFARKTAKQVCEDFKRFAYKVHWALPDTKIIVLSIKPSPARWAIKDTIIETNRLIAEYCKKARNLTYIDVFTPMLDGDGKPREELFKPDRLHLNRKGYDLWVSLLRPELQAP